MKKVLIFSCLFISFFSLISCQKDKTPQIDYGIYHQMNELITISDLEVEVVRCFINPFELAPSAEEVIMTVRIDYTSLVTLELKSNQVVLIEPLNNNKITSNYTVDGLDYLKDPENEPFIRFVVKKGESDFVMQITHNDEQVLIHLVLE